MLRLTLLFILTLSGTYCQNFLDAMLNNTNISIFADIFKSDKDVKDYLQITTLTIFVPDNNAMKAIDLSTVDKSLFVKNLMYKSLVDRKIIDIVGTTTNWTNYEAVNARNKTYYRVSSIAQGDLFLFANTTYNSSYCNEAKVITPNITVGSQVYHVIDRALFYFDQKSFMERIQLLAQSESYKYWQSLNAKSLFAKDSTYSTSFLEFSADFPGTILVPTNEAWKSISANITNSMSNFPTLENIMARYYIPDRLLFFSGQRIRFKVGFNKNPRGNSDGLMDGLITRDFQVRIGGYSAKIVTPNILIRYGVIHVIDNALVEAVTLSDFLTANYKEFFDAIMKYPSLANYMNGSSTILPPDSQTMKSLSSANVEKELLNSFIQNSAQLSTTPVQTVGNLTIQLKTIGPNTFIRVAQSIDNDTWIRVIPVSSTDQVVGKTSIRVINGTITGLPMTCDETLKKLNSNTYQSLLSSVGITLNVGSPYTMLVPDDQTLNDFLSKQTDNKMRRYVIQRMIIANELIFKKKSAGAFRAATMNNAAMNEYIDMSITGPNCTVSYNTAQQSFSFDDGGYRCYSNGETESTRYNLIYPVKFVLTSPVDNTMNICVVAPCVACRIGLSKLLLVAIFCWSIVVHIPDTTL